MVRVRRGGFIFITWKGDHPPRHVHVYRDGRLVVKWNLDSWKPMEGDPPRRLIVLIQALRERGIL